MMPLTVAVNKKLYITIKNEEHLEKGKVIQAIIKTYALVQCIAWPCICGIYIIGKEVIIKVSPPWNQYITASSIFMYSLLRNFVACHSLIIAVCRYTFIILEIQADKIGICKLRSFFISSTVVLPLVSTMAYHISQPIDEASLRWFYGESFSSNRSNYKNHTDGSMTNITYESPLFLMFNRHFPLSSLFGIYILNIILLAIIYSNFIEGLIYTHIFIYNKRYKMFANIMI